MRISRPAEEPGTHGPHRRVCRDAPSCRVRPGPPALPADRPPGPPDAPKGFQKNVVQVDSRGCVGAGFCHALYRTRCFIS